MMNGGKEKGGKEEKEQQLQRVCMKTKLEIPSHGSSLEEASGVNDHFGGTVAIEKKAKTPYIFMS
jgi:hypothetical protein